MLPLVYYKKLMGQICSSSTFGPVHLEIQGMGKGLLVLSSNTESDPLLRSLKCYDGPS